MCDHVVSEAGRALKALRGLATTTQFFQMVRLLSRLPPEEQSWRVLNLLELAASGELASGLLMLTLASLWSSEPDPELDWEIEILEEAERRLYPVIFV